MSVLITKYPELSQQLLMYMGQIQRAANAQFKYKLNGWRQYDWCFRKLMARYPYKRWDIRSDELWSEYITDQIASARLDNPKSNSNFGKGQNQGQRRFNSKNICKDFNKQDGCNRQYCKFKHFCLYCKKPKHNILVCKFKLEKDKNKSGNEHK